MYELDFKDNRLKITFNQMINAMELCNIEQIVKSFKGSKVIMNLEKLTLDAHGYAVLEGLIGIVGKRGYIIVNVEIFADIIIKHGNLASERILPAN